MRKVEIRCQERQCSYGKPPGQRCLFGNVDADTLPDHPVREWHRCCRAKKGEPLYEVMVVLGKKTA